MKKENRGKNILDLKHQELINYMNILIISIISSSITILLVVEENLSDRGLISIIIILIIAISLIILFFETKFKEINNKIEKL